MKWYNEPQKIIEEKRESSEETLIYDWCGIDVCVSSEFCVVEY